MKTEFRLLSVGFSIIMLCAFASVPAITLLKYAENSSFEINIASIVSLMMLLLFLGGLVAIIKLTKIIVIDEENKKIVIRHPFLLESREYSFCEILGFRWSYLSGRINYKSIKLKATDNRVYQFSDFETGNFRGIEKILLKNFDLKYGKDWKAVSDKQKNFELQRSKAFDVKQAEDIRFYLWLAIIMLSVLSLVELYSFFDNGFRVSLGEIIFFAIILLSIFGLILKLKTNTLYLKNHKA